MHHQGQLHLWAPVAPCQGPLQVRNPLDQAASVILVQDTPGWMDFGTHGISSGSHICINARMTPANPLLSSNGPLPGMVIWL